MNIGDLNRRITYFKAGVSTPDGLGGYTVTEGEEVETWCNAMPLDMAETLRYGLVDGSAPFKFTFYYHQGKNLQQGSKMIYEGVEMRVKSVIEIDEAKDSVVVLAIKKV